MVHIEWLNVGYYNTQVKIYLIHPSNFFFEHECINCFSLSSVELLYFAIGNGAVWCEHAVFYIVCWQVCFKLTGLKLWSIVSGDFCWIAK